MNALSQKINHFWISKTPKNNFRIPTKTITINRYIVHSRFVFSKIKKFLTNRIWRRWILIQFYSFLFLMIPRSYHQMRFRRIKSSLSWRSNNLRTQTLQNICLLVWHFLTNPMSFYTTINALCNKVWFSRTIKRIWYILMIFTTLCVWSYIIFTAHAFCIADHIKCFIPLWQEW